MDSVRAWMLVRLVAGACLIQINSGSAIDQITLVAPNVFHYGETERVVVMWEGGGGDVEVYLEAWPERAQQFSISTKRVGGSDVVEFEVTVNYDDLPEGDALDEAGNRYVYVVARKPGAPISRWGHSQDYNSREVRVMMSETVANVFLQTDKPVYTPNQQVQVAVYTTDMGNKPKKMPLRVDILTPNGIVVNRQEKSSEHMDMKTGDIIHGVFRYTFSIGLKPVVGNWSVTAYTGPNTQFGVKYLQSTSVSFEVEEYVLPSFECSIGEVPEYIRPDDVTKTITVTARYSHGQPVEGTANVRFGIAKDGSASYIKRQRSTLTKGHHQFQLRLQDMYSQEPYFSFSRHAAGNYLFIQAECTEKSSGETKESISLGTMFVTNPYTVDFDRSPRKFKPGLPLVYQFVLKHANGRPAVNTEVKIVVQQRNSDRQIVHLSQSGSSRDRIRTDANGIGQYVAAIQNHVETFSVEIQETSGAAIESRFLQKLDRPLDLALHVAHRTYRENETISVGVHTKGSFSTLVWMVLARGQIVSASKSRGQLSGYQVLRVPVLPKMVPSARVLVYLVAGSQVVTDTVWIDVTDECSSQLSVKTEKSQYEVKDRKGNLEVTGSPHAYVMVQMVDQAVLMLNAARSLTPQKLFSTLGDLDLGCSSVTGATSSEAFRRAGLVVSSDLRQVQGTTHINAGLRLDETGCDDDDFRLDSDCCDYGKNEPITSDCSTLESAFIEKMYPSEQCILYYRECCGNNTARRPKPRRPIGTWYTARRRHQATLKMVLRRHHASLQMVPQRRRLATRQHRVQQGLPGLPGRPGPQPDFSSRDMYDINRHILEHGIRRNFPESVILGPIKILDSGKTWSTFNLPDSITSWNVEAVELSGTSGMCVAPPHNFSVLKNYFIKLHLPYKAVRQEQLMLTATFHNEVNTPVTVELMMRGVEGICSKARPGEFTRHTRTVAARSAVTVSWPIVAVKQGQFPIKVVAMTADLTILDAVDRLLTVVPEGLASSHSESFVVEPSAQNAKPQQCNDIGSNHIQCYLELRLPREYVPNSASGVISITANTFGPAVDIVVNGLASKLRMPSGCGEQVMIHTSPGVYAYNYMLESGTSVTEVENKFQEVVKDGVNRILAYLKENGGIGVWTTSPASTWLTSFVLKVFAKASQLVGGAVDELLLERAVHFLYSMQHTGDGAQAGRFREHSQVSRHHGEMIGAVKDTDLTLTAFVTIALMEAASKLQVHQDNYQRSVTYLGQHFAESQTAYEAALVAYALSESPQYRTRAFDKLRTFAVVDQHEDLKLTYFPGPSGTAKKIHVETAAYAILTALNNDAVDYCYGIVLWLHQQRRNDGIFQTTQDTVVALQALSEYSAATRHRSTDLHVKIALGTGGTQTRAHGSMEFDITDEDKNREFIFQIDEDSIEEFTTAIVQISGQGVAQLTMQTLFNLHQENSCAFDIDISPEMEILPATEPNDIDGFDLPGQFATAPPRQLTLTVCAKHLLPRPTEMAIMDIGLLTGFQPQTQDLQKYIDSDVISAFEISDKSLVVYLPSISHERDVCITFKALQEDPVANLSPAPVRVYDYYNRESECSAFYSDSANPNSWELDFDKDECHEGTCPKCYGSNPGDEVPWVLDQFHRVLCTPQVTFILKAEFTRLEQTENWNIHYMTVRAAIKIGNQ